MGLFLPTFFQTRPRRTFEYKPRYYNEEQERLDLLKKKYAAEGAEPAGGERAEAQHQGAVEPARAVHCHRFGRGLVVFHSLNPFDVRYMP